MNPQEIKEFLKSIKYTDIEEMEYHNGNQSLYFKKSEVETVAVPIASIKKIAVEVKKVEERGSIVLIKSTMVGTFVNGFIRDGDNIVVDQKIGQIEAMKIIKDIKSKVNGKIVKVFVSNGQAIEYGQKSFLVNTASK